MLLHCDGFDTYSSAADLAFEYSVNNMSFATNAGRYGGGGVQMSQGFISKQLSAASGEFWCSCAFTPQTLNNNSIFPIFSFVNGSEIEAELGMNIQAGVFYAYRGAANGSNVLLGQGTFTVGLSNWYWLDVHYKPDGSNGTFEVWINGTRIIDITGVQTNWTSGIESIQIVCIGSYDNGNHQWFNIDDWVINDTTGSFNNGRMGDLRISSVVPNSDAGPNNGTPSTSGPHYAMVDEAQWSNANNITLPNTSGDAEMFGSAGLTTTPSVIYGVRVVGTMVKSDGGSAELKASISSSGVGALGPEMQLSTSTSHITGIFEEDPNTSAAFSLTAVNALHFGFEVP